MQTTTNYGLKKPEASNTVNIDDLNYNADAIDSALTPTANPATAPSGNGPYKLVNWLGYIANRIKAITGKTNWYDAPDLTLASVKTHVDATSAHNATAAATANRMMVRDSNGRAKVAAPSASDDIAQKAQADAVQANLATHAADFTLQIPYAGSSTNSGNDYAISSPTVGALSAGMAVSFKCNADSTGATTLNWCSLGAKAIKRPNGTSVANLKAGGIYTLRYDGTNFCLQGEGGSGTAIASEILATKTATTDAGDITGTMTNNGAVTITPGTSQQTIAAGYHNGSGYVAGDADLVAANIKTGVSIFGVTGTLSGIKSIQYVSASFSSTSSVAVDINAVDVDNTIIIPVGDTTTDNSPDAAEVYARWVLTDADTVTASTGKNTSGFVATCIVLEFVDGVVKSKQSGTKTLSSGITSGTVAITSVTTSKTLLIMSGHTLTSGTSETSSFCRPKCELTNSTTITFARGDGGVQSMTIGWNLLEFN